MRFAVFTSDGRIGLAVADGAEFHACMSDNAAYPGDVDDLLAGGQDLSSVGKRLLAEAPVIDLAGKTLLPPVRRPGKILCAGLNYVDHTAEIGLQKPAYPDIFLRVPTSLCGHNQAMLQGPESREFDFEGELAVIIGKGGRRIKRDEALAHVAGYAAFNDGSMRDFQMRSSQWIIGKNFDRTGAFGPWLVTSDVLPAGGKGLDICTRLNGRIVQHSNTEHLIFAVPDLIAYISQAMTLLPGDVLVTGTPGGVGMSRKPQLFMRPGDVCEVEIEGIGVLSNPVAVG